MLVVFRVDASSSIGSGHVMRCLTLAQSLRGRGADIVFAMRAMTGDLVARVRQNGFDVLELAEQFKDDAIPEELDAEIFVTAVRGGECLAAAKDGRADWVIVDYYQLGKAWEAEARTIASRVLAIDDVADRSHEADVLLDQNLVADYEDRYATLVPQTCLTLLGPGYALLSEQYRELRTGLRRRPGVVRRILVYFGGADRAMTRMAVDALTALPGEFSVQVVLDDANPQADELIPRIAADDRISICGQLPNLAGAMADADLFVGASGTTSWERLCLGLKAVVVTLASNQEPLARELDRLGFVTWLGRSETITQDAMLEGLRKAVMTKVDAALTARMMEVVDGFGAERVADVVTFGGGAGLELRYARQSDSELVLKWANDPATRRYAFNSAQITTQEHTPWFDRQITSPDTVFFLAESPRGIPVGQVRFQRRPDQVWEISYLVAPLFRGRGIARPMLAKAIDRLFAKPDRQFVAGYVKPENMASVKVFEALGFSVAAQQDSAVATRYELARPD